MLGNPARLRACTSHDVIGSAVASYQPDDKSTSAPMGTNVDVWATVGVFSVVLFGRLGASGQEGIDEDKILTASWLQRRGDATKRTD